MSHRMSIEEYRHRNLKPLLRDVIDLFLKDAHEELIIFGEVTVEVTAEGPKVIPNEVMEKLTEYARERDARAEDRRRRGCRCICHHSPRNLVKHCVPCC